jgi:hypothetical protein
MIFGIIHLRDGFGNAACNYTLRMGTVTRDVHKVTCLSCKRTGLYRQHCADERRF